MQRRQFLRNLFGIATTGVLIAGPVEYGRMAEAQMRNFRVFQEGILYRSGQMTVGGLKQVVHDYGIRTVISLRDAAVPGDPPPDRAEERWCDREEINYYRLPPRTWWAPAGPPSVEDNVRTFNDVMADPANYPVLIHCFAGIHRTGAYCAIYRMEHDRWSNADAIAELHRGGYDNLYDEWDILGYLEEYRPTWKGPPEQAPPHRRRPPSRPDRKDGKKASG